MTDRERRRARRVLFGRIGMVLALILFVYGVMAASAPGPKWGPGAVVTHFVVSVGFGILCHLAAWRSRGALWMALGIGGLIALAEVAQFWVPNRTPSLLDGAAGLGGLVVGFLLAHLGLAAVRQLRA